MIELQVGNPIEMTKVSGDQLQVVVYGCGSDLNVRIREGRTNIFEMSSDLAEYLRNAYVVGQNGDGR